MWEYEGFIAKAALYFSRAEDHPAAEDDVLALWLLLGLEFLLRAPLAKVHPSLLADPTGNSLMHAVGIPMDSTQPKSIQTKTVILRLGAIVPDFSPERQEDANFLVGLRNSELHSSDASLELDVSRWLPHFTRVVEVIYSHLDLDPFTFVGRDIIRQGRALVDKADKRLEHEIRLRISSAKEFFAHLKPEEIKARQALANPPRRARLRRNISAVRDGATGRSGTSGFPPNERVDCPACQERTTLRLESIRSTNERLEDEEIVRDIIYIAIEFTCLVCGLELRNTAEIRAAGIEQQYVRTEHESIEDRFMNSYDGEDYGND